MATSVELKELRRLIDEPTQDNFTDDDLDDLVTKYDGDVGRTAGKIWLSKAAGYSTSVDISEAGSSRKNSDLYKNAMELARIYGGTDDSDPGDVGPGQSWSTTRKITRP